MTKGTGSDRLIVAIYVLTAAIVVLSLSVVVFAVRQPDKQPSTEATVAPTMPVTTAEVDAPATTVILTTTTASSSPPSATVTVPPLPVDACAVAATSTARLAALDAIQSAELVDELTSIRDLLAEATTQSAPDAQAGLAAFGQVVSRMTELVIQLEGVRPSADEATAVLIDDVLRTVPNYFRTMASVEGLTPLAPQLVNSCALRSNQETSAHDMFAFSQAIDALIATGLAARPELAALADYHGLSDHDARGQEAMSSLVDEFDECRNDPGAKAAGDDAGCDALRGACEGGDMLACNDLFYSAGVIGSDNEMFGASCGNRITPAEGRKEWGGFCEGLP